MLFTLDRKRITAIPHKTEFNALLRRISDQEYQAIKDELNDVVDKGDVHTSSWIPGRNWENTVFGPLYDATRDVVLAAKFYGVILWIVMMERNEAWSFGRYEKNNVPIEGLTYFRIQV